MQTIIVTGATGFLGGEFVRKYHHQFRIIAFYRNQHPDDQSNVIWQKVDLNLLSDFESFAASNKYPIDAIVHIGGASPNRAYQDGNFDATIKGTVNLIWLAQKISIGKFVFISTLSVLNDYKGPYVNSKLSAEDALIRSGITYTILRPTTIIGKNAKDFGRILDSVCRFPVCPIINNGQSLVQPVSSDDLVQIISAAINLPRTNNKIYEIGGKDCLTQRQFMEKISHFFHRRYLILPLSVKFIVPLSRLIGRIAPKLGINEERVKLQTQSVCLDHSYLETEFGVKFDSIDNILAHTIVK